jgi:phenylacetate-coenzyme A ligase PaaK-like adenylate-forming protein
MSEFLFGAPELTEAQLGRVRKVLADLRSVPGLGERYADVPEPASVRDMAAVPVMNKTDLQTALAHLQPRAEHGATWLFQSGGSTGAPQVGYAPTGLYMDEVYEQWKPLGRDDIFVNGWSAGKMWGAHFLVNSYTDHTGCLAMNLGAMSHDEYDPWLEFFANRKVTAFGGTPSVLRLLFGHARDAGVKLPDLRKVLWLGEAWDAQLDEDLAVVAPNARRWGMFGSTETWVAATNTPDCAADTWHPVPSRLIGFGTGAGEEDFIDFTCLNADVLNPVLRYRTGDAGTIVTCTCGDPSPAMKIFGRRDGLIKFRGHLVNVADTVADLGAQPGVARAQLVIEEPESGPVLEVRLLPSAGAPADLADRVREHLLRQAFGPAIVFQRNPHALRVTTVDKLTGNDRTGKIPDLIRP